MFDRGLIGRESAAVRNEVERGAIRKFAESIGDPNPLYYDEEYARATCYGGIVAPPTFCRTFVYGDIPGLNLPREGMIHGEQEYTYFKPLRPGDEVYCMSRLVDIKEKEGKSGRMIFITIEQEGKDSGGELYYISRRVGIISQAVIEREASQRESRPAKSDGPAFTTVPGARFEQVNIGDLVGPVVMPPVSSIQLVKYAGASGDFNPIHTVEEVARELGLNGVIAHGMLTMAILGRLLTDWIGTEGVLISWGVRFRAMVRPGDVITCRGIVTAKDPAGTGRVVHSEVWGENQKGEKVIGGRASVKLP